MRAGKCKDLVVYEINPEKCIGCGLCARNARCLASPERKSSRML